MELKKNGCGGWMCEYVWRCTSGYWGLLDGATLLLLPW